MKFISSVRRSFFFFLLSQSLALSGQAQDLTLGGIVVSPEGTPVPDATINLVRVSDQTLVQFKFSDASGTFLFEQLNPEYLQIVVEHPDFAFFRSPPFELEKDLKLAPFIMEERSEDLAEVEVIVKKPFIEQLLDKTIINVDKSISNAGSTALQVLTKAPGVVIDQNDEIKMRGRSGVIVMIDGKPVPMSASDLANMLRGLPSNSIEKIELITNPSAKYEAAGSAGIIDIKLKKDSKIGTNGSLNTAFGQGRYFSTTQGLQLNHCGDNLNIFGNYSYSLHQNFTELDIYRKFLNEGVVIGAYDQQNRFKYSIESHTARIGADYNFSQSTFFGIAAYGLMIDFDRRNRNQSLLLDQQEEAQSFFVTRGNIDNKKPSGGFNINFRHTIDKAGREISGDLDYVLYQTSDFQAYHTEYFSLDHQYVRDPYILRGDLAGHLAIRSIKSDYSQPFPLINGTFEAGAKVSIVEADNNLRFYDRSDGGNVLDENISNHFLYEENINAAYANLKAEKQRFNFQFGLRIENTIARGNQVTTGSRFTRQYTQLFPSGFVGYKAGDDHDLGLSLSRRIDRPTYNQLNPFKTFLDPSTYTAGNPFLQPELSYSFEFTHTYSQKYMMKYSYTRTEDVIITVLSPDPNQEQVVMQTTMNLATLDYYGFTATLPFSLGRWFTSTNNGTLYYSLYKGNLANTNLDKGRPTFTINSNNLIRISEDWSAELIGVYKSAEAYAFLDIEPLWSASAGIQKRFSGGRGTVKMNLSDVFFTQKIHATTKLTGYSEKIFQVRDSRVLNIGITYRFGKSDLAPVKQRKGGAEEEKGRVG